MRNTHTPGPWTLDPISLEVRADSRRIAAVAIPGRFGTSTLFDVPTADANAALIAAAPDLLAAVRDLLREVEHDASHEPGPVHPKSLIGRARAAIARAEGR